MQVLGNGDRHFDLMRVAGVPISRDDNRTGGSSGRHASNEKFIGAYQNRAFDLAKAHLGATQFWRMQAGTSYTYFSTWQSCARMHGLNSRVTVNVFFA